MTGNGKPRNEEQKGGKIGIDYYQRVHHKGNLKSGKKRLQRNDEGSERGN